MTESADDPKGTLPEFTKKLISLGLGAYFLTEEKIVGMVQGAKMPKEIGSSITSGASKAQKELMSFITREIASVIKKIDIQEEFQKALSQHKIKINAEIEFIPLGEADESPNEEEDAGSDDSENKRFNINTTIVPKPVSDPVDPDADGHETS